MRNLMIVLALTLTVAACGGSNVTGPSTFEAGPALLTAEVSQHYGGAIVGLHTPWGNAIDSSNGGTLLSTAIWTLPIDPSQQEMCPPEYGRPCPGSLPFHNPTQGGYFGDGHAGNPYDTVVEEVGGEIHVSYRAVNYNYGWPTLDRDGWQTHWYGDMVIRQKGARTVSVKTRITYCKTMAPECAGTDAVTQDNQLSTIFGRGQSHPDPAERGQFTEATPDGCITDAVGNGVCLSIPDYAPTTPQFGVTTGPWPSVAFIQPDLMRFAHAGVTRVESVEVAGHTYSDIPRFQFSPGGWYEFETLISLTGGVQ